MEGPHRLFISPHPDDIAYSCFASLVNPPGDLKSTLIVTVFNRSLTALNGFGERGSVEGITQVRRKEELLFASTVGCQVQFLEFPDTSVRFTSAYSSSGYISRTDAIYFKVKKSLSKIIIPFLGKIPIYIPLGIGEHPDHCIVRDAVKEIIYESPVQHSPHFLLFYEDLPYAIKFAESAIKEFAFKTIAPTARSVSVDLKGVWRRKKRAVGIYESQLKPRVLPAITKHARLVGSEYSEAERLWFDEPGATIPLVQTMVWVSREPTQPWRQRTIIEILRTSQELQTSVGRTILLGLLHRPRNCTFLNMFENIEVFAGSLYCDMTYPATTEISYYSISNRARAALQDIERRYNVDAFYLCDREHSERLVDRILIDLSDYINRFGFCSKELPDFIEDRHEDMDISLQYISYDNFSLEQAALNLKPFAECSQSYNSQENIYRRSESEMQSDGCIHKKRDSIHSMALAQLAADCLKALPDIDKTFLLIMSDILSLPTVYAFKIACHGSGVKNIRSLLCAEEFQHLHDLVIEATIPQSPSLNGVVGFKWENAVRCLIRQAFASAESDAGGKPHVDRCVLHLKRFRHFGSDLSFQIIQKAWKRDCVAAPGRDIRDELFALKGKTPLFVPTVKSVPLNNTHPIHLRIHIINEPSWPEADKRPTATTRDDLHRTTGISLCLSTYDGFNVAPLQPLSCSIVSTECERPQEPNSWQANVLLAKYSAEPTKHLSTSSSSSPHSIPPTAARIRTRIVPISRTPRLADMVPRKARG